jgi:hypothetical protein
MSSFWLEQRIGFRFWREVVAAAISPPVAFNCLVFGARFDGIFRSKAPDYYSRLHVGIVSATQDRQDAAKTVKRHEGTSISR